jgi:hypothetical protein
MKLHRFVSLFALAPLLFGATSCGPILAGGTFSLGESSSGKGVSNLQEAGFTRDFSASGAGKLVVENEGPGNLRGELRSNESPQSVATFQLAGQDQWVVELEPGDAGSVSVFREGEAEVSVLITVIEQL